MSTTTTEKKYGAAVASLPELAFILRVAWAARQRNGERGLSALLWGLPGVGKTQLLEDFAHRLQVPCINLAVSTTGDAAFGVVPTVVQYPSAAKDAPPRNYLACPPHEFVRDIEDAGGEALIFLDELTTADGHLQKPLLGILHGRRIGMHYLGARARVWSAANPPDVAVNGWDLAPPVANRIAHFQSPVPTEEEWGDYILGIGDTTRAVQRALEKASGDEAAMEAHFEAEWQKLGALLAAFHRANHSKLHVMPRAGAPAAGFAWPSHRSWETGGRAFATALTLGGSLDQAETVLAACIGDAGAHEFVAFVRRADLPDPRKVLDGIVDFRHDPARIDRTMAAVTSLCGTYVRGAGDAAVRAAWEPRFWHVMGAVTKAAPDLAALGLRHLTAESAPTKGLTRAPAALPVMKDLRDFLREAGEGV